MVDLDNGTWTDVTSGLLDDIMGQGVTSGLLTDSAVMTTDLAVGNADIGTGLCSRTVGPAVK